MPNYRKINVAELLAKHNAANGIPVAKVNKPKSLPPPISEEMRAKMVYVNEYSVGAHWRKRRGS